MDPYNPYTILLTSDIINKTLLSNFLIRYVFREVGTVAGDGADRTEVRYILSSAGIVLQPATLSARHFRCSSLALNFVTSRLHCVWFYLCILISDEQ